MVKKSYNPFKMWGSYVGLILTIILLSLLLPSLNYENDLNRKESAWDGYNFCLQCGDARFVDQMDLNCVMDLCEIRYGEVDQESLDFTRHTKEEWINTHCESHPDIDNNHPEAFIRGFCGYDLWDGFGYGEKPNKLGTYFSGHNYKESVDVLGMGLGIFAYVILLLIPILGFLIGWGIQSSARKVRK